MIQELVEFGKQITKGKSIALKEEPFTTDIVLNEDGEFQRFIVGDKRNIETEVITAKKGKARFLLDKCEEVLGVSVNIGKLEAFQKRLEPFKNVSPLNPVFEFYDRRNVNGLKKAIIEYLNIEEKENIRNMTFVVDSDTLLSNKEVQDVIENYVNEQNLRKKKQGDNLSFKKVSFAITIVINKNGEFQRFIVDKEQEIMTGVFSSKKENNYILLGRADDLLGITKDGVEKKHHWFIEKLLLYKDKVQNIEPVLKFYEDKNENGVKKAVAETPWQFTKDFKSENITFMVGTTRLLEIDEVRNAIIEQFNEKEKDLLNGKKCSICGANNSPVLDEPHGLVKMPKGQQAGCALISYNNNAFESYGLKGNLNSSICRNCASNYIDGLRFLLSNGDYVEDKKKSYYHYNHRINISDNTVALFWTREKTEVIDPFSVFDAPDTTEIKSLFDSVWSGKSSVCAVVDTNMFYTCTMSSAAARIAVRDWTALSLDEYKTNLAEWFHDIEMIGSNGELAYSPLNLLIKNTQPDPKPGKKTKSDLNSKARIGNILWNAAVKGHSYKIPLEVMQYVLNRIWKKDIFSKERAALIKIVINRNTNKHMKSTLDETNTSLAYLCGRLFAVIETMQWKAMGNVNNGVKERFFAATASQPSILGTLLTKNVPIYQHKIKGYLAKELNEITVQISKIGSFPRRFSTIEQGEFALGYYFQKNHKKETTESNN